MPEFLDFNFGFLSKNFCAKYCDILMGIIRGKAFE
jgi:hypothetical protein